MINWIKIEDGLPSVKLMIKMDILILREDKSFAAGVFYCNDCGGIDGMRFNGTSKAIELWKFKPTHWAIVDLPEGD